MRRRKEECFLNLFSFSPHKYELVFKRQSLSFAQCNDEGSFYVTLFFLHLYICVKIREWVGEEGIQNPPPGFEWNILGGIL